VDEPSAIYFPLRSNAASLLAGAGVASVRRRLLLAALLHDRVLVESGLLRVAAGPTASQSFWLPPGEGPPARWQSARSRGAAKHGSFYTAMRPSSAPETAPMHVVSTSTTSLLWAATFEPFRRELPAEAAKWIEFGHVEDPPDAKDQARRWSFRDRSAAELKAAWPEPFVRDVYVKGAHLDLATSSALGTALSFDGAHAPVLATLVESREAEPVRGSTALGLLVPTGFDWADVAELRKQPALMEYRAVLREVESAARDGANSLADLERAIHDEYSRRVEDAAARRTGRWASIGIASLGLVVGVSADVALAGVPGAGTIAATTLAAAEYAVGERLDRRARPRWLTVHSRIRRRS